MDIRHRSYSFNILVDTVFPSLRTAAVCVFGTALNLFVEKCLQRQDKLSLNNGSIYHLACIAAIEGQIIAYPARVDAFKLKTSLIDSRKLQHRFRVQILTLLLSTNCVECDLAILQF